MRTDDEYQRILLLWEQGNDKSHISRLTGIPRATIRDCIKRFGSLGEFNQDRQTKPKEPPALLVLQSGKYSREVGEAYCYLLGFYLGDGYVNKEPRTYKLRIALDTNYADIITQCIKSIETLLPYNKVGLVQTPANCVHVVCYNSYWPEFFPQHGKGEKHTRQIVLVNWQQKLIETQPLHFFRGLYHSDGCRDQNMIKGKPYPRYSFKNHSDDIRHLFSDTCEQLELHCTTASNGLNIQIARRADVAFLDQHIGLNS